MNKNRCGLLSRKQSATNFFDNQQKLGEFDWEVIMHQKNTPSDFQFRFF